MIMHDGNLLVSHLDICDKCDKCFNCTHQYSIADTLKDVPDCVDVSFNITSCTKFIPIQSNKPTNGTINDLIRWSEGK